MAQAVYPSAVSVQTIARAATSAEDSSNTAALATGFKTFTRSGGGVSFGAGGGGTVGVLGYVVQIWRGTAPQTTGHRDLVGGPFDFDCRADDLGAGDLIHVLVWGRKA